MENTEFESNNNKIKPEKKKKKKGGYKRSLILVAILLLVLVLKPYYILNEGETAIITYFGKVVNTETSAGLHLKIPLFHQVHRYTAKLLRLDGDPQKILTKEKQYIEVNTTSRWRITDIKKFYKSVKTYQGAFSKLSDILNSSIKNVVSVNSLANVIRSSNMINETPEVEEINIGNENIRIKELVNNEKISYPNIDKGREVLANEILEKTNAQLDEFGIEVVDIIFKQIKYSDELQNSVFNRMIKERNQIAQAYRSEGEGKKAEWLGKLQNEKKTILSKAYAEAEEIKGKADAEAVSIYAKSYGKSPEFYSFWKSIEIYKQSLPQTEKILSTDMEYFKYLYKH